MSPVGQLLVDGYWLLVLGSEFGVLGLRVEKFVIRKS